MYEVYEHTADLGLRVRAADLDRLFADAARGLFSIFVANPQDVRPVVERRYHVAGEQCDLLLFDWLSELLVTFDTERLLLAEFDVRVGPTGMDAICRGEPVDEARHHLEHEVKAITYHDLRVERSDDGWLAELIVDI